MPKVNSSAISRIEYDDNTSTLRIWFVESGGPYDYRRVPRTLYDRFLSAPSKGSFFNDYIRDQYGD